MSRTGEVIQYGAMGVGVTIFLWVVFSFAPALMLSLSITDARYDWDEVVVTSETLPLPDYDEDYMEKYYPDGETTYIKTTEEPKDSFASACFFFCILFMILAAIQGALVSNIRVTWPVVGIWWIISLFPFLCWLGWLFGPNIPFPGINWMPW